MGRTKIAEKTAVRSGTNLIFKDIEKVMHDSMLPYAEHVIMERALPRVEDGLKPVQRRILYTMHELGVTPDKPTLKSARIVGDCMGKYHPHGDSSIYQALVRMAQDFNLCMPLVDGQGNFGSNDGDGAAAMRYTEARLSPLATELLADIDEGTVSWSRNYDDSRKEPDMLPGRFPNLLVNGANGIAVGLSTNIPPHNFAEVIDACAAYIDDGDITSDGLLRYVKGPDFPTGGYVIAPNLREIYETGNGKLVLRGKLSVETDSSDRKLLVVTELPYQVVRSQWLAEVAKLKESNNIQEIVDIVDESDKDGVRAVIKLRKDADEKAIAELLYKKTSLEVACAVNMVAIAGNKPVLLSLRDAVAYYVEYQRKVVTGRTEFRLGNARDREHIVNGLVIAVGNIDEVIDIIKKAENTPAAKRKLIERFSLSDIQAQAILDLRLSRITKLETSRLLDELKELRELIESLSGILGDGRKLDEVIKSELAAIKKKYRVPRRSTVVSSPDECKILTEADIVIEDFSVTVSEDGRIKKVLSSRAGESGKTLSVASVKAKTLDTLLGFTDEGNCFRLPLSEIPLSKQSSKGSDIRDYVKSMGDGEKVVSLFSYKDIPETTLVWATADGNLKRTEFRECVSGKSEFFPVINLRGEDKVVSVSAANDGGLMMISRLGMGLNVMISAIPVQGRVSSGVQGMTLEEGDSVFSAEAVSDEGEIVLMTDKGSAKRVFVFDFEPSARRRKGVKAIEFGINGSELVFASYVREPYDILVKTDAGEYILNTENISIETRQHKGKVVNKGKVLAAGRI